MFDINRDPKVIGIKRALVFAVVAAATLQLLPASAQARYDDGMNLYEYVGSTPIIALDPQGTVLVAFRGWGGIIGEYKSDVTAAIVTSVSQGRGKQKARHYNYDKNGFLDALRFIINSVRETVKNDNECSEPIYVVGYSIGARTAFVLGNNMEFAWGPMWLGMGEGHTEKNRPTVILILLDYNWGAYTFTPPDNIRKPMFRGESTSPHSFITEGLKKRTKHIVSTGKVKKGKRGTGKVMREHTKDVFDNWKEWVTNKNPGLWDVTNFQGRYGYNTDDLANTSGLLMHGDGDVNWGFAPWIRYSQGDHLDLGKDVGFGTNIGARIRLDYLRRKGKATEDERGPIW